MAKEFSRTPLAFKRGDSLLRIVAFITPQRAIAACFDDALRLIEMC